MSALMWWLIPIGATVLALGFVLLRSRPEKPTAPSDSMDHLRRMQEAMERPLPGRERAPRADDAGNPS